MILNTLKELASITGEALLSPLGYQQYKKKRLDGAGIVPSAIEGLTWAALPLGSMVLKERKSIEYRPNLYASIGVTLDVGLYAAFILLATTPDSNPQRVINSLPIFRYLVNAAALSADAASKSKIVSQTGEKH